MKKRSRSRPTIRSTASTSASSGRFSGRRKKLSPSGGRSRQAVAGMRSNLARLAEVLNRFSYTEEAADTIAAAARSSMLKDLSLQMQAAEYHTEAGRHDAALRLRRRRPKGCRRTTKNRDAILRQKIETLQAADKLEAQTAAPVSELAVERQCAGRRMAHSGAVLRSGPGVDRRHDRRFSRRCAQGAAVDSVADDRGPDRRAVRRLREARPICLRELATVRPAVSRRSPDECRPHRSATGPRRTGAAGRTRSDRLRAGQHRALRVLRAALLPAGQDATTGSIRSARRSASIRPSRR